MKLIYSIIIIVCVVGKAHAQSSQAQNIIIPFGTYGQVVYHLSSNTYDVLYNRQTIIYDAYANVKNADTLFTSKVYTSTQTEKKAVHDGFGNGIQYIITLSKAGYPQMQLAFYTYTGRDYFFVEVKLKGKKLQSNYMSPMLTTHADIIASGDNRSLFVPFDNDTFISYIAKNMSYKNHNASAEVTACYENQTNNGLVVGSVEHQVWKTGISVWGEKNKLDTLAVTVGYTDVNITRDEIAHGYIKGDSIKSPKIFIGYFSDWRTGMEEYAKANRIAEPPYVFNWNKPTPVGWNSWGVIQAKLNFDKAIAVTDFFADSLPAFRNGSTAFIDLDSFWDNITNGVKGDFAKLKAFADYCKSKGLEPGVYWAPFTDWGYKAGPQRVAEGSNYTFGEMWTKVGNNYHDLDGARALDPTHPGTQARIKYVIGKLKACGFKMIKIDFLGHAAVESGAFYDTTVTTGMQAYKKGMEFLIDQLGNNMLVYAAISPSLATARYAHMRRIACDAFKSIKDTRYTLNSLTYGWWQTFSYNYIDADHVVFDNESDGANRARFLSAVITGTLITGDDYSAHGKWTAMAKQLLQDSSFLKVVKKGVAFRPMPKSYSTEENALFYRKYDNDMYVAVFNYDTTATTFMLPLSLLNINKKSSYSAKELFSGNELAAGNKLSIKLNAHDAAFIKISNIN